MMLQQVASMSLALAVIQLAAVAIHQVDTFPSLFTRGSLFRRTNGQQQAQQQQQQHQQPTQTEQLVPLANSVAPISFQQQQQAAHFGQSSQLHAAELMRLSGLHQQIGAHPLQHMAQQHQQQQVAASLSIPFTGTGEPIQLVDSSAQSADYYKPNAVLPMQQRQQQLFNNEQQQQVESEQAALQPTFDLYDNSPTAGYLEAPESGETGPLRAQGSRAEPQKGRHQMQLEPTHTSEVVDKIERHIDRQIERGMAEHDPSLEEKPAARQAAASGYHQGHKTAEKEAAASGEESASEAGESGHAEEKSEKHHEPEMKEHKEEEHHHHHHHHEGAPEAFEIHHKKGGKSFQYFHQGHSH